MIVTIDWQGMTVVAAVYTPDFDVDIMEVCIKGVTDDIEMYLNEMAIAEIEQAAIDAAFESIKEEAHMRAYRDEIDRGSKEAYRKEIMRDLVAGYGDPAIARGQR